MPLKDFNEILDRDLKDPEFAVAYLEACLQEGIDTFLIALRDVARVKGGMSHLAEAATLRRESLYKALSEQGNPEFKTLHSILGALGMRFSITRAESGNESRAPAQD